LLRLLLLRFGSLSADPGREDKRSIGKLLRSYVAWHRNYIY